MSAHQLASELDSQIDPPDPIRAEPSRDRRLGRTVLSTLARYSSNKKALLGALILAIFGLLAILAPVISPGDPNDLVGRPRLGPSSEHWLGTTSSGQDVFAQTIWGARVSLSTGLLVGLATTVIGGIVGMTAGYFGHRTDDSLSFVTNIFLIMPSLPLLIALAAFLPAGFMTIVIVLSITGWAWPARILRSQTLSLRDKDFIAASKVSGESSVRIIFVELLPNMLSIIAASFIGSVIYGIGAQAGLEFIGLGDPSVVSWGTNLYWASNNAGLLTGAWWTFIPAGLCIALVAFALSLLNYAIDEITNPRLRSQRGLADLLKRSTTKIKHTRATPVIRESTGH